MLITIIFAVIMMAGLFLLLWSGIALIQDKRYFTSAPKEIQDAVQPRPERFPHAHALGFFLVGCAFILMIAPIVIGCIEGIACGYDFWQFFIRFLIMLLGLKLYDILFFDLFLLCHSGFFPHYYPEVKGIVGPHLFGYNWKTHLIHIIVFIALSAGLALLCGLFVT